MQTRPFTIQPNVRERGNFTVAICQFTYLHCLLLRSRWLSLTGSGTLLALARHGSRSHIARTPAQGPNSIDKIFGLSFGLKNHLSFGLRFPTPRQCSKMGLDMSQNQNGTSSHFSSQNSSQNVFCCIAFLAHPHSSTVVVK